MKELKELAAKHGMIATEVDEDGDKKYLLMEPTYSDDDGNGDNILKDIPSGMNFQLFKNKESAIEYINSTSDHEMTSKSVEWVKKYEKFVKGESEQ